MSTNIATKQDIALEIAQLETKLITALGDTKTALIKWILGTMVGTILSLAGLGFALAAFLRP